MQRGKFAMNVVESNKMRELRAELNGVKALPLIATSKWQDETAPGRMWLLDQWLPLARGTFLTGKGGSGKSLLAQQLATCVALGLPFMGNSVRRMNALYLTCEDDAGELHRRTEAICQKLSVTKRQVGESLHFLSRNTELNNWLIEYDPTTGRYVPSAFYDELLFACKDVQAQFLVLDNVGHLCPGFMADENAIGTFCSLMEQLALSIGGAVLFIGHPPKSGSEFGGLSIWENRVRSRIFLEGVGKEEDGAFDPDLRILKRSKANYAKTGETIRLRWHEWAFEPDHFDATSAPRSLRDTAQDAAENAAFLAGLKAQTDQLRALSHSPHATNYAPKAIAKMALARGIPADALARAMERLFGLGTIKAGQELWRAADRKFVVGIAIAGGLRDGLRDGSDSSDEMIENLAQVVENNAGRFDPMDLREGLRDGSGEPMQVIENNAGGLRDGSLETPPPWETGKGNPPKGGFPLPGSQDDADDMP